MTDEVSIWLKIFTFNTIRYVTIAGVAFLIFYILIGKQISVSKLQSKFPTIKDYSREIIYSFISFVIFAFVGLLVATRWIPGVKIYGEIETFGWGYFILSIFLSLLIHDTYFYWTHRAMHNQRIFKVVHLTHHRSNNPSPWASFSFSPIESFFQAFVIVVITWILPMHPY